MNVGHILMADAGGRASVKVYSSSSARGREKESTSKGMKQSLGALSHLLMMSGGNFFLQSKGMEWNHRDRDRRCTTLCVTNVSLLSHQVPMVRHLVRLGAHTNLSWTRSVKS